MNTNEHSNNSKRGRGRPRKYPFGSFVGPRREKRGRPATLPSEKRQKERIFVRSRGRPRKNQEISSSILDKTITEKNLQTPLLPKTASRS